jgi:hypothetical protein
MKHYGFIMPSTLASELNMSLKDAKKILDEFVSSGEARQLKTPFGKIYDIPSVRIFLLDMDRKILKLLSDFGGSCNRIMLFNMSGLPNVELFNEVMERLERLGLVSFDETSNSYSIPFFKFQNHEKAREIGKNKVTPVLSIKKEMMIKEVAVNIKLNRAARELAGLIQEVKKKLGPSNKKFMFGAQKWCDKINGRARSLASEILELLRMKFPFCPALEYNTKTKCAELAQRLPLMELVFTTESTVYWNFGIGEFYQDLVKLATSEELANELYKPVYKMLCVILDRGLNDDNQKEFRADLFRRAMDLAVENDLIGKKPSIYIKCPRCKNVISGYEDICPACGFDTLLLVKLKKPEPRFVQRIGEKWIAFFEIPLLSLDLPSGINIAPSLYINLSEHYAPDIESFFEEGYPDDYYREFYADINILKPPKKQYKVEGEKDDIIKKLDSYISHIKEHFSMIYRQEVIEHKCTKKELYYSEDEFVNIAFNKVMKVYTPRLDSHPIRFV